MHVDMHHLLAGGSTSTHRGLVPVERTVSLVCTQIRTRWSSLTGMHDDDASVRTARPRWCVVIVLRPEPLPCGIHSCTFTSDQL
jgi:hypothetical protein